MFRIAALLLGSITTVLVLGCSPAGPTEPTFTIGPATDTLKVGQTIEFYLKEEWPRGVIPPPTAHYWSIDNPAVASIEAMFNVHVTGRSPGRALLTGCLSPDYSERCDSRLLTVTF